MFSGSFLAVLRQREKSGVSVLIEGDEIRLSCVLCFGAERGRIGRKWAWNAYWCMWEYNRSTWQCVIMSIPCNRFLNEPLHNSFFLLFISQQNNNTSRKKFTPSFLAFPTSSCIFSFPSSLLDLFNFIPSSPYTNCISTPYIIMLSSFLT